MTKSKVTNLTVKICGLRHQEQTQAIVALGFCNLGFICVPSSPRYVSPTEIKTVIQSLNSPLGVQTIGVFANQAMAVIQQFVTATGLTGIQLHGGETPDFCQQVKQNFPYHLLIKALRIRSPQDLALAIAYYPVVDVLLLDAYHPEQLGGTGQTLPWQELAHFAPPIPWWLAGGLRPDNIRQALEVLKPDGVDLSSGVEKSPSNKDLAKVEQLKAQLQPWWPSVKFPQSGD